MKKAIALTAVCLWVLIYLLGCGLPRGLYTLWHPYGAAGLTALFGTAFGIVWFIYEDVEKEKREAERKKLGLTAEEQELIEEYRRRR